MLTNILPISVEKPPLFSADDRILLGEGLIETIRVDKQQPCYPQLHRQRMYQAAKSLGIPFDVSSGVWHEQLLRCIHVARIQSGGIKVILSGGRADRGLDARGDTSLLSFEAFSYPNHRQALRLVSARWLRDAKNPIYQYKTVNYLESILARRQALANGANDALFFNLEHRATETTIANLFIIKHDQIFTPMLEHGILAGITRARVLCLCKDVGISCVETAIDTTSIAKADAVFVTNALQGMRSVESFDGSHIPVQHPLVTSLRHLLVEDPKG